MLINIKFRKDIWIKNPQKLSNDEKYNALRKLTCILTCPLSKVPHSISSLQGEFDLTEIYKPFYAILGDNKFHSIGELEIKLKNQNISIEHIINVLLCLNAQEILSITQYPQQEIIGKTEKLNNYLLEQTFKEADTQILVSPYTGSGISIKSLHQIFIKAYNEFQEKANSAYLAKYTLDFLSKNNIELFHKGKKHNLVSLLEEAEKFMEYIPLLQELRIIKKY